MNITSIIVLVVLLVIVGGCLFICWSYISLETQINKEYAKFEKNHLSLSEKELRSLMENLKWIISDFHERIQNQKIFIETHPMSEYASDVDAARRSLVENENKRSRYKRMMSEVERELQRREHDCKYK